MLSIFTIKSIANAQCFVKTERNNWLFFNRSSHTRSKTTIFKLDKDRNKTDSHRFKPNSGIILINEQFNLSLRLHNGEMTNRHRGDKRKCRYDRLIFIILLSLAYFLSDVQMNFHSLNLVQ